MIKSKSRVASRARRGCVRMLVCGAVFAGSSGAGAQIISATSGLPILASPPVGLIDINTPAAAWDEMQLVQISNLVVSMRPVGGLASDPGSPNPGPLSGMVRSHFIHLSAGWPLTSVTFNDPIVGVSYRWPDLGSSDFLSPPGPVFDPSLLREFFWGAGNPSSFIQVNGNTITFLAIEPPPNWSQIRVLTAPAPGTMAVFTMGALIAGRRRRR